VRTVLISGGVRFEDSAVNPLLDLMPPLLHIRGKMSSGDPLFGQMLAAMGPESLAPRPGGANVMTRLSNVLVTNAVRSWLEHGWDGRGGFLGAVTDPGIGRALALMHRRPEETWTVTSLAERIKMSRSTFSEKFTTLVGLPPMQYLTRWRMHLATRWLEGAVVEPDEVASRLGYESEPSFRSAFKKHAGVTPRAARKTPPEL
jgi:transcriptional regulator GlxA family with amidase domain